MQQVTAIIPRILATFEAYSYGEKRFGQVSGSSIAASRGRYVDALRPLPHDDANTNHAQRPCLFGRKSSYKPLPYRLLFLFGNTPSMPRPVASVGFVLCLARAPLIRPPLRPHQNNWTLLLTNRITGIPVSVYLCLRKVYSNMDLDYPLVSSILCLLLPSINCHQTNRLKRHLPHLRII